MLDFFACGFFRFFVFSCVVCILVSWVRKNKLSNACHLYCFSFNGGLPPTSLDPAIFLMEWPMGCCVLLKLTLAAHYCKARPCSTVWLLMFLPLFPPALSEWAVVDVFMVGNKLIFWQ